MIKFVLVSTMAQYITVIYLALTDVFKAPIKVKNVTEFCFSIPCRKMSSSYSAVTYYIRFLHDEYQIKFTCNTINVTGCYGVAKISGLPLLIYGMFAKKYAFLFLSSQQIQYGLIMHLASYYFV